jgi:hypothetical protein
MSKFTFPRRSRIITGLVLVSAFAAAPVVAQAATTQAQGLLSTGGLTNTAPAITAFPTTLTGVTQTVNAAVGTWNVTDASGSNRGYTITVGSSAPTDNSAADGTGTVLNPGTAADASITLTPTAATATAGNPTTTWPVDGAGATTSLAPILVSTGAPTVANAAANTGQGSWDFAGAGNLAVTIPGNASAGYYSSTLTYTSAPLADVG